jgi:general secretion pathway protein D
MKKLFARPMLLLGALSLLAAVLAGFVGCAGNVSYRKAETAAQDGDWDAAVIRYIEALQKDPTNISYQSALLRAKIKASQAHFQKGQQFEKALAYERALVEYQEAVQLDTTNQYAAAQLERTRREIAAQHQNKSLETIDQMKARNRGARPQPPVLNPRSNQPISLEFPQPVSIFQIYHALGQAFGINIIFDPQLKDQDVAIDLRDVTAQTGLETLMRTAGHFYKVIDEHTILIAADTPANRRTYEDLVIQTFFLSNAEVKDMTTILRSLIDARKIATNDQLNAIILRDTADKVKVAEKIIETNDKSKAEVVVDVELLQIDTTKMQELGVALSSYSIGQQLDLGTSSASTGTSTTTTATSTASPGTVHISDLYGLNQSNWLLTIPSFMYNFAKQVSDAQLLAKPQMRITEGEKSNLVIGDKVPIPVTSFSTSNTIGGSIVPITSFQYQDVGIKIEIEPRVHHNQEVTLKVKIEVSNLGQNVNFNGQQQPTIGTRSFDSTIRLKDGETNFLAGLIRTDDSRSDRGIPGLSDIPVIGRLFSDKAHNNARTDLILTLTPHIIRNAEITEDDLLPIWAGTDANITFRQSPRVESENDGPFEETASPEDVQDQIRRRIQRLPRGLQDQNPTGQNPTGAQPAPPPAGVNLAPVTPPSDIFRVPTPAPPAPAPNTPPPPQPQPQQPPPTTQSKLDRAGAAEASGAKTALAAYHPAVDTAAAAAKGTAAVKVWLTPRQMEVSTGEHFDVDIQVAAEEPIAHLPFTLKYDPKLLAIESIQRGDFFGPESVAEFLAKVSQPGEAVIGASLLGDAPAIAGAGTIAHVTFRALVAGTAQIGFSQTQALDSTLHRVMPVAVAPATVEIDSAHGGGKGRTPLPDAQTPPPTSGTAGGGRP